MNTYFNSWFSRKIHDKIYIRNWYVYCNSYTLYYITIPLLTATAQWYIPYLSVQNPGCLFAIKNLFRPARLFTNVHLDHQGQDGMANTSKHSQTATMISWILFQNKYFVIKLSWSCEYFVIILVAIHSCLVWLNICDKNFCNSI